MSWIKNLRLIMSAMSSKLEKKADKSEVEKQLSTKAEKSSVRGLASKTEVRSKVDYTKIAREWNEEIFYPKGSMVTRNGKFYVAGRDFPPDFGWDDKDWVEERVASHLIDLVQHEEWARKSESEKLLKDIVGGVVYTYNWPSPVKKGRLYLVSRPSIQEGEIRLYKCVQSFSGSIYDWSYLTYLQDMTIAEALGLIEADEVSYDGTKTYPSGTVGYEIQHSSGGGGHEISVARITLLASDWSSKGSYVQRMFTSGSGSLTSLGETFSTNDMIQAYVRTSEQETGSIKFQIQDTDNLQGSTFFYVRAYGTITQPVTITFVITRDVTGAHNVISGY